jgi:hypothetical protein
VAETKRKGMKKRNYLPFILIAAVISIAAWFLVSHFFPITGKKKSDNGNRWKNPIGAGIHFNVLKNPFEGKTTVTLKELLREVERASSGLQKSKLKKAQFAKFSRRYDIDPTDENFRNYLKATLLFEATRDAGLWHIRWEITNMEPNSDRIWSQWQKGGKNLLKKHSAVAECDEISALYAFLMKKTGTGATGLYWPTRNHTVAVWKLKSSQGKEVRVVVPTTQVFLMNEGLFGTNKFNPWKQPEIYDYTREDVSLSTEIPADLAGFFVLQMQKYGGASEDTLQYMRNVRESIWVGTNFTPDARKEVEIVKTNYTDNKADPADIKALEYFLSDFLGR